MRALSARVEHTGVAARMAAVAGCPITAGFDGDASLRKRPMRRILSDGPDGGTGRGRGRRGRLPIALAGARDPMPIVYLTLVASAQLKSAVLLTGTPFNDRLEAFLKDP
jgi:3-phosphoshikimate 1-carboxyvinyltransferase